MKTKAKVDRKFLEIKESLAECNQEAVLVDGFEGALIGYVQIFNRTIALYDKDKCVQILMDRDKMTYEEAVEFFEFNTQGASVGENTPGFATILRK